MLPFERHGRYAKARKIQLMRALLKLVCPVEHGSAGRIERHADKLSQLMACRFAQGVWRPTCIGSNGRDHSFARLQENAKMVEIVFHCTSRLKRSAVIRACGNRDPAPKGSIGAHLKPCQPRA
jgi:hypothetical protein